MKDTKVPFVLLSIYKVLITFYEDNTKWKLLFSYMQCYLLDPLWLGSG